jgi:tRNA threonylcarbamoyladenosine biosynthesis protein TsaE
VVSAGEVVLRERGVTLKRLESIGNRLARSLRPGDLVLLYGPLGAGKTTLVRSIASALKVADAVRSPSFTIANIYHGSITVQHLDLYRLEEIVDEDALALEEYAREDSVTLVEWPQAGVGRLGPASWIVRIEHESPHARSIEIEAVTSVAADSWERAGGVDA